MALLTREQILAADDRPTKSLRVEEWNGDVLIASLSIRERGLLRAKLNKMQEAGEEGTGEVLFLSRCLVDEAGKPLFSEKDLEALSGKGGAVVTRVFDAAWEFNGLSTRAVEDAEKNSGPTPNGHSSPGRAGAGAGSPESSNGT